jgi:hypothetical protein
MTPPDVRNEWTVGYIVNLKGSVVDRGAGTAAPPVGSPLGGLRSTDAMTLPEEGEETPEVA